MCLLLAQLIIGFFSFFAAAVYSTDEANKAGLKQSIFLDVYGFNHRQLSLECFFVKAQRFLAKFGWFDMKILFNIRYISLTLILAMQIGKHFWQLLLWPLLKFGDKVQKIFWTQTFGLDWIWFCFVSFTSEIFCSAQISHLPIHYFQCNAPFK